MTEVIAGALREPRALLQFAARRPDLTLLSLLLAAGALSGGGFGTLELHGNNLRLTEIGLAVVALLAVVRLGVGRSLYLLATRAAPIWLGLLVIAGGIGALRGIGPHGFHAILYDIQFFAYIVTVPIVVLVADTRERARALAMAMLAIAIAAMLLFAFSEVLARITNSTPFLADQEGETATGGFFGCLIVGWLIARYLHGDRLGRLDFGLLAVSLVMIGLTDKRTAWLAFAGMLVAFVVLAPLPRRAGLAAVCAGAILFGGLVTYGIERVTDDPPLTTATYPEYAAEHTPNRDETGVGREIGGVFGGDSPQGENVKWRLAYWGELLSRMTDSPSNALIGAGFGPEGFVWNGNRYDFREADSLNPNDTTGPHSAFIGILYLTGPLGLIGLVGLMASAARALYLRLRSTEGPPPVLAMSLVMALIVGLAYAGLTESLRAPELATFIWATFALALLQKPGTFDAEAEGAIEAA